MTIVENINKWRKNKMKKPKNEVLVKANYV